MNQQRNAPAADLTGRVAVVTGATGGIGKEIARGLAGMGADVVVTARDPAKGEATRGELAAGARGTIAVLPLDVADLASVRAFAEACRARHGRLDVLVNNAGAWFTDRRESPDGYELTFATNVLGPYLLTELLLDTLRAADRARVVNVVSSLTGDYDPTDLQFTRRRFDGYKAYTQSKQALTMLTWGLAARLAGSTVTANTAAPGFVRTGFNRNARGPRAAMIGLSARLFAVSAAKGADTPLWVASAPELATVNGQAFAGRKARPAKFTAPQPIAELEVVCAELTRALR
jgi:NAD(P)-dependent dehydrogenase (short-subunit alcohol dehydrogenase family)